MGASYLTDAVRAYHYNNIENCFITLPGGIKMPLPKYYKDRIYDDSNRDLVTQYLQQRIEANYQQTIVNILNTQTDDEDKALAIFEMSKLKQKFEPRLTDVL